MEQTGKCWQGERRHVERRMQRMSFVLAERRTGFDRRACREGGALAAGFDSLLRALRDRPAVVRVTLVAINLLNAADYLLTLNCLAAGGKEVNPVMRALFAAGSVPAGLFKITVVLLVTSVIWFCRRYRSALKATIIILILFIGVFLYHIIGLSVSS